MPGRVGGSETYARELLVAFARLGAPERVTALTNGRAAEALAGLDGGGVQIERSHSYREGASKPARLLAIGRAAAFPGALARELPRDLDLIHYPLTVPVPRTRVPSVVSLLDLQHRELPQFFSRAEREYRRLAYERAARSAAHVITISEHSKRTIVERLGIDPARVDAIHLGIDHERFGGGGGVYDDELLAPFGLPERFLYYGANAWPHKNHDRLIAALGRVSDRGVELVLTGNPYDRLDVLMDAARRAGVGARVRHLGFVPADVLPALLRRAQALVFPSLYEGFGQPPLEAMAAGCPVISSTRGSLAEVVAGAALEIDPEDVDSIAGAIDRVLADEELAARLRADGRERAHEFTWDACAARHVSAYQEALERSYGS